MTLLFLVLGGCTPAAPYFHQTWSSRGQDYQPFPLPAREGELPRGAVPVGGVVSHHLLAGALIDSWFAELAARRRVKTFFILSPGHWNLGTGEISLTRGGWRTAAATVYTRQDIAAALVRLREVEEEVQVFSREHGISTLIPFIARYFPSAGVVALAYPGEPPVDLPRAQRLWAVLAPYFTSSGREKNFLLVSTDFTHHGTPDSIRRIDTRTRRFFNEPGTHTWIFAGCDNRPGIYALARLAETLRGPGMQVLYHSDSWTLTGLGETDITSYFFTFLYEKDAAENG